MPEGHSVHRVSRQFELDFVGHSLQAFSPQGRFAAGAEAVSQRQLTSSRAVGKQLFLGFEGEVTVRIHLGIYGAWDFAGEVTPLFGGAARARSVGAPRRSVRVSEDERDLGQPLSSAFPPEPVGAVRLRLLTERTVADLRGPTACEVLDPAGVQAVLERLGPDPISDLGDDLGLAAGERFLARVRGRRVAIGLLLMDQSVVAGIGNVYRAEILFRAGLNPHTPAAQLDETTLAALWADWCELLPVGIRAGRMLTRSGEDAPARDSAKERYWVYKRAGLPCRRCGTQIQLDMMANRKLYWCPTCQT
jgi:endonuclease-8